MKDFSSNVKEDYYDFKLNIIVHYIKVFIVVIFIVFEEIAWKRLGEPAYNAIKSLKIMDRFKEWIADIDHRYKLLVVFLIPFVLMEISSIYAGSELVSGSIFKGLGLYSTKLMLTAPVVIIFNYGKKILVSFWVIKYGYGAVLNLKRSKTFRSVKIFIGTLKESINGFNADYLNSMDGNFSESIKKMYLDLRKV